MLTIYLLVDLYCPKILHEIIYINVMVQERALESWLHMYCDEYDHC
jgi:hypothetical protein